MKKRILLLVSALFILFISSKAYAYWTDKFHFNVRIPVAYELEVSVITDEEMQEQKEIKTYRIERETVTENEEIPLSIPNMEEKEVEDSTKIKTEGREEAHTEESYKEETVQPIKMGQEQSQMEQDLSDLSHNEGN